MKWSAWLLKTNNKSSRQLHQYGIKDTYTTENICTHITIRSDTICLPRGADLIHQLPHASQGWWHCSGWIPTSPPSVEAEYVVRSGQINIWSDVPYVVPHNHDACRVVQVIQTWMMWSTDLGFVVRTTLYLFFRGLTFFGTLRKVFRPKMTAFCFPVRDKCKCISNRTNLER